MEQGESKKNVTRSQDLLFLNPDAAGTPIFKSYSLNDVESPFFVLGEKSEEKSKEKPKITKLEPSSGILF
jgi:hypothetical protein